MNFLVLLFTFQDRFRGNSGTVNNVPEGLNSWLFTHFVFPVVSIAIIFIIYSHYFPTKVDIKKEEKWVKEKEKAQKKEEEIILKKKNYESKFDGAFEKKNITTYKLKTFRNDYFYDEEDDGIDFFFRNKLYKKKENLFFGKLNIRNKQGIIISQEKYRNGIKIANILFNEKGEKDGMYKRYNNHGLLTYIGFYEDGEEISFIDETKASTAAQKKFIFIKNPETGNIINMGTITDKITRQRREVGVVMIKELIEIDHTSKLKPIDARACSITLELDALDYLSEDLIEGGVLNLKGRIVIEETLIPHNNLQEPMTNTATNLALTYKCQPIYRNIYFTDVTSEKDVFLKRD